VSTADLDSVRRYYDRAAPDYDRSIRWFERTFLGDGRQRVCAPARARTLELGVGTGLNFGYYPPDVQLTGIDVSPAMVQVARERAQALGIMPNLVVGDAQALEFPDATFDTVVCTISLCTIPDSERALEEAYRVLKPGGQLLLLEHVRSPLAPVRFLEWALDPLARLSSGCHLLRDPLDHLTTIGFGIEHHASSKGGIIEEVVAHKASALSAVG
jgi:ubiquinone/menaquinone biosynthesis C-methylase UbiE